MDPEFAAETVAEAPLEAENLCNPAEEAIIALNRAWIDARLYPPTHPAIAERLHSAQAQLAAALAEGQELIIKHVDGELVHGQHRLFRNQPRPAGLIGALSRLGIGYLAFRSGVTAQELSALCRALSAEASEGRPEQAVQRLLTEEGVTHIRVERLGVLSGSPVVSSRPVALQLYDTAMDIARRVMQSARLGRQIDMVSVQAVTEQMVAEVAQNPSTAVGLASLRGHDEYSFAHCVHTALLCLAFGDFLGLKDHELRQLGVAAILHDVGKSVVPVDVLRKPSKLSPDEWELMTRHPAEGALMLLQYENLPANVPLVAFEHHMGCNCEGYPKVRTRRELSLPGMIVALADVYDALTTHRPYRPAIPPEEAIEEMSRMARNQLNPRLVSWFRTMLGVYPPGSCVVLNTGEMGVVCSANHENPERPFVCIVTDQAGRPLDKPADVSLTEKRHGQYARSIRRSVAATELGLDPSTVIDAWIERHHLNVAATQ